MRCVASIGLIRAGLAGLKVATDRMVRRAEAQYPPVGASVTVDGIRVHYVERGSGPALVLVPRLFSPSCSIPAGRGKAKLLILGFL